MTGSALVQAENYDHGGEGVAFHDLDDSNTGGQYRNGTGVDIQTTTDTGGGYNVTSAKAGEWIGYTVALDTAGLYNLNFRVATSQTTGGVFHVLVDGVNATGAMTVPGTGNNQTWTTITKTGVNLSAGVHDVRVVFDTNGSAGVVGNLNWMQFVNTTPPPVPAAPSNLVVTNRSFSSVSLAWSDNSSNESGFTIERKAGIDGTWTPVGSALGNSISYIDNTAAPGTFYFYRVRANSSSGDSLNSNETSVTTTTASAVTYLSDLPFLGTAINGWGPVERDMNVGGSGAGDGTTIVLNGVSYAKGLGTNAVSDVSFDLGGAFKTFITDVGVDDTQKFDGSVQFQVFADNVLIFDSGIMGPDSPTQSITRDVTGVHTLRLLVGDGGDGPDFDWADWAGARLTTQSAQLSAPTNLVASALSPTQVKLTWTDNSIGETGTRIERSTNGIDFTEIATAPPDATSFIDTTASPGGSYTYRVRATSGGSNSDYSNTYAATTPSLPPITYISDMQWDSSTNGWGPVERDMNVGGQSAGDGTTLKLNGTTYTKGLGTNSPSTVTVTLNGSYGWFLSDVGVDDHQTTNGSVTFQVWADNVKIYDSGLMKPTTATQSLTLSMAGVKQLQLVVTDGGDGNASDWADWANARLLPPGALPTPPAAPTSLAATVSGSSIALSWADNASNEDNYLVERSTDNVNFSQIASLPANSMTYTDATVAGGITYYYRVRASNSAGPSGYSNVANNVVNPIPAPWTQADVGSVGSALGSASYSNGTFLVRGGGSSTGGFTAKSDVFHYVYQSKSGNFTITSHVVKVQNTNSAAKAGIMVRNGTAANAVFVGLFVTPGKGVVFVRRTSAGGAVTTTTVNAITAPVYLRLTRSGNTFTAYRSSDNITWTTIGTASVTMPTAVTTGLVVSSMVSGTLNTSTFDNVSIV
jgi:regulation of enolase protein 1 (concanavalin A-like superfamily)